MNNFTSMVLAILERVGVLTADEAKKLARELHGTILPDNYEGASALLDRIFTKHEIKPLDTKASLPVLKNGITSLEADMADLRKWVEGKVAPKAKPVDTAK